MYPNGYVVEYVQESDNSWRAKNGDGINFNSLNFDGNYTSFSQGDVEDSWLLSGIISFASSPQGLSILQDACKRVGGLFEKDGNKIELDNKKYKVDDSTVLAYQEEYVGGGEYGQRNTNHPYSFGDSDVTALEIAFTRYLEKLYGKQVYVTKPEEILKAGSFDDFAYALTGRKAFVCNSGEYNNFDTYGRRNFDLYFDVLEQTPSAGVISFVPQNGKDIIGSAQGQAVQMTTGDENTWAIKSVQGNYVTLVNPCNTSIEYVFTREELEKKSASVSIVQFDK